MDKFDRVYGSKWMKAVDLDGVTQEFQIETAEWQDVGVGSERGEKIVVAFVDQSKDLILNVTNANELKNELGKELARWAGRWVEAREVETAKGPGIRLRVIEKPAEVASADIPF